MLGRLVLGLGEPDTPGQYGTAMLLSSKQMLDSQIHERPREPTNMVAWPGDDDDAPDLMGPIA